MLCINSRDNALKRSGVFLNVRSETDKLNNLKGFRLQGLLKIVLKYVSFTAKNVYVFMKNTVT